MYARIVYCLNPHCDEYLESKFVQLIIPEGVPAFVVAELCKCDVCSEPTFIIDDPFLETDELFDS